MLEPSLGWYDLALPLVLNRTPLRAGGREPPTDGS